MADNIAIKVSGVSKMFKLPREKNNSIKSAAINFYKRKKGYELQRALNNISFEVEEGEFFGIVGRNGSGKSTLLKMLAGIYSPSKGSIEVSGKLTPFIELGVGFNPELTGRENVFLNGALLGFNRKEMNGMYNTIVEFAELEQFMDQKLKNYSSGMQVRLAFSIAIRAQSDILLIDEVLAVGDSAFQRKCYEVFTQLKKEGRTLVFVTHDMAAVERFCDKAMVIDKGKVVGIYSPSLATVEYDRLNSAYSSTDPQQQVTSKKNRWGVGNIKVKKVQFLANDDLLKDPIVEMGDKFCIKLQVQNPKAEKIVVGLAIEDIFGVNIAGPNSFGHSVNGSNVSYTIDKLSLLPGEYKLTIAVFDEDIIKEYDHLDKMYSFRVISEEHRLYGKVNLFGIWNQND